MPKKRFQFKVQAKHPPQLEMSDAGIYVRFQPVEVKAHETVIRSEWPHVAIDLAKDGTVVGIECVPAPSKFSIGQILEQAGLSLPARLQAKDFEINRTPAGAVARDYATA